MLLWLRTMIGTYLLGLLLLAKVIALCCVLLALLILKSIPVSYTHLTLPTIYSV